MTTPTSSNSGDENPLSQGEENRSFAPTPGSGQPNYSQTGSDFSATPTGTNNADNASNTNSAATDGSTNPTNQVNPTNHSNYASGSAYAPPMSGGASTTPGAQTNSVQPAQNGGNVPNASSPNTSPNTGMGAYPGGQFGVNQGIPQMQGGFATNPGGQTGAYPGYPGNTNPMSVPMTGLPQVADKPNGFVIACKNLFLLQGELWAGKTGAAFDRLKKDSREASMSWALWLVPFVVTAVSFGLAVTGFYRLVLYFIIKMIGLGTNFMRLLGVDLTLDWNTGVFVCATLCGFFFFMFRTVGVWLTHRAMKVNVSFQEAANQFAAGLNVIWLPMLLLFVLSYTTFGVIFLIVLLCLGACILFSELVTYIGISRTGGHKRSPATVHVWLTLVAVVLLGIVYSILSVLLL